MSLLVNSNAAVKLENRQALLTGSRCDTSSFSSVLFPTPLFPTIATWIQQAESMWEFVQLSQGDESNRLYTLSSEVQNFPDSHKYTESVAFVLLMVSIIDETSEESTSFPGSGISREAGRSKGLRTRGRSRVTASHKTNVSFVRVREVN